MPALNTKKLANILVKSIKKKTLNIYHDILSTLNACRSCSYIGFYFVERKVNRTIYF